MALSKSFFLSVTLWLLGAQAQCPPPSTSGVIWEIKSTADALLYSNCSVITGTLDITIGSNVPDGIIYLDAIQNITGNLQIKAGEDNGSFVGFSMRNLSAVGGYLQIFETTDLTWLNFTALESVGIDLDLGYLPKLDKADFKRLTDVGGLWLNDLPSLTTINLDEGIRTVHSSNFGGYNGRASVVINNTGLANVDGLRITNVSQITITNNVNMKNITLEKLTIVKPTASLVGMTIQDNSADGVSLSFPALTEFSNTTLLSGLKSISIPSLEEISGHFEISGGHLSEIYAPVLNHTSGNFFINEITSLQSISLPLLLSVDGDMTLWSLGSLKIVSLPLLTSVGGYINLESLGNLTNFSLPLITNIDSISMSLLNGADIPTDVINMPKIERIGEAYIDLTKQNPDCRVWDHMRCVGIITDRYICGSSKHVVDIASDAGKCNDTYPLSGWTLAMKLKVGLGVGLSVPACILIAILIWRRYKSPPAYVKDTPASLELELPQYSRNDEPNGVLPIYSADTSVPPAAPPDGAVRRT